MPSVNVDLAHEPDFRLGVLLVRPSVCAARAAGREQHVEPRVMAVLVLLARGANRTITRDDLIEACWGGRFVSEDAITRVIGKVRSLARSVEPAPFVLETVPKVGFRLITQDRNGAKHARAPPPAPGRAGTRPWTWRRTAILTVGLLLAALITGWASWRFSGGGRNGPPAALDEWVDVAGFAPQQNDPALKRLALLADDALIRALVANGVDTAPFPAASKSSARLRMAGTVDRDGDRYVISTRLEDRSSGAILWSRRLTRPIGDPASFQETIAGHLSDVLRCGQLRARAYRGRMPDRLLALFLDACSAAREDFDRERYLEVTRRLAQAAPRLSAAHSMHAAAAATLSRWNENSDAEALRQEARIAAQRAIELDPGNGEAFAALATAHAPGGWREREANIRRALQLGWTPANNSYIWLLLEVGRMREATDLAGRTAATSPFATNALERSAWLKAVAGDLTGSKQALERLELNDPAAGIEARLRIALWHHDPRPAAAEFERAQGQWPAEDIRCVRQYLLGGWLEPGARRPGLPADCATQQTSVRVRMLARSGQVDAAYRMVDAEFRALQDSTIFVFYPEMKRFRQDPRFMPLAKRFGLVDYWRQTNRWPDFCEEPDLPYDCRTAAQATLDDPT